MGKKIKKKTNLDRIDQYVFSILNSEPPTEISKSEVFDIDIVYKDRIPVEARKELHELKVKGLKIKDKEEDKHARNLTGPELSFILIYFLEKSTDVIIKEYAIKPAIAALISKIKSSLFKAKGTASSTDFFKIIFSPKDGNVIFEIPANLPEKTLGIAFDKIFPFIRSWKPKTENISTNSEFEAEIQKMLAWRDKDTTVKYNRKNKKWVAQKKPNRKKTMEDLLKNIRETGH